jgi:hypothetical protein
MLCLFSRAWNILYQNKNHIFISNIGIYIKISKRWSESRDSDFFVLHRHVKVSSLQAHSRISRQFEGRLSQKSLMFLLVYFDRLNKSIAHAGNERSKISGQTAEKWLADCVFDLYRSIILNMFEADEESLTSSHRTSLLMRQTHHGIKNSQLHSCRHQKRLSRQAQKHSDDAKMTPSAKAACPPV